MGKERKYVLASSWERIERVRRRFRKSQPWLRFPEDADGEPVPISTKSLAYNVEVLSTYFSHVGLRTDKVMTLTKEVLWAQR